MKIALCQFDPVIGDFDENTDRMLAIARSAAGSGAELIVFPELSLCGYPPMDLLDQDAFADGDESAFCAFQRALRVAVPADAAVAVGHVGRNRSGKGRALTNAVSVVVDGRTVFEQAKTLLPTYDVFDEARYFEPAAERKVFEWKGRRIGFAICEDIWWEAPPFPGMHYAVDPTRDLLRAGADMIVVPSASPFHADKLALRVRLCSDLARSGKLPVLYCNMTGANDSLVFDGRSFAIGPEGALLGLAGSGEEILLVDDSEPRPAGNAIATLPERWEELERALVEGIRGYMRKCGFKRAHLGLSGGIDSAIVAVLAAKAIGPDNLTCITMPSRFSSAGSVDDSAELCRALGCRLENVSIESPFGSFLSLFEPYFGGAPFGVTEENLQARIRGDILMAWSNRFDSMLLTTGNKSELATGYCTLYGDMCGALAPIGDLLKTEVFELCESIHAREGLISRAIIDKPPSAELRPGQLDQDSLPPYALLDAILLRYIVRNESAGEIVSQGFDGATVRRVITMVARAEYKRRQAAPVIKVSPRAFGTGRRIPIARAVHEAGSPGSAG